MSDTIISVENLGKKYVLSHQGERGGYTRFSEKLEGWIKKPFAALSLMAEHILLPQPFNRDDRVAHGC